MYSLVAVSFCADDFKDVGRGGRIGRAYSPRGAVVEDTGDASVAGLDVSGSSGVVGPTVNCHGFLE